VTNLQRRALTSTILSTDAAERIHSSATVTNSCPGTKVREILESHERLRSELQGLQVLYDDASRDADRLNAEVARLRKRLQQIASADWLLAGDLRTLADAALTETDPADASPTKGGAA